VSEQENKAIIFRFYEEVWNKGNLALVDELVAPAFINHSAGSEEGSDRESFKQTISRVRTDLRFHHTVEELIAEGDTVVARLTGHGETGGESSGGERFTAAGVVIWKLHNGQMVERWAFWEPA
jgi:predicted ester cyclase